MPRNRSTNPKAGVDLTAWSSSFGTGTGTFARMTGSALTADGQSVSNAARMTMTTASTSAVSITHGGTAPAAGLGNMILVYPGETISSKWWVRTLNARAGVVTQLNFFDANNVSVGTVTGTTFSTAANTWTQVKTENKVVPAGAYYMQVQTIFGTAAISEWFEMTAVMINEGVTAQNYFDGSNSNANMLWNGPTDLSPTIWFEDYQYMYQNNGIWLNGPAFPFQPFIDVKKVSGLDLPNYNAEIDDVDSQHGGNVYSRFSDVRTIVIEGMLYIDPTNVEPFIDRLIWNYMADNSNQPFIFKHPGVNVRYILCKVLACKFDVDELRRVGVTNIQLQLAAEDPRKYVDQPVVAMTSGTTYTITNQGNVETFPIFTITGAMTSASIVMNPGVGGQMTIGLTTTRVAGDVTVVDLRQRSVTINGVQNSAVVNTPNWWKLDAYTTRTVKVTIAGAATTTMLVKNGWM